MSGTDTRLPDAEREAMRRRLYRPGATTADVVAYAAVAPPEPPEESTGGAPPPARRPVLAVAVPIGALVLALVVALALRPPDQEVPAAAPSATVPAAVPTDAERAAFVARLSRDGKAGISAWLARQDGTLPGAPPQAAWSTTFEFAGSGSAVMPISPTRRGGRAGRVTVLVVLSDDASVTWTLLGPAGAASAPPGPNRSGADRAAAVRAAAAESAAGESASGAQDAGVLTAATISYAAGERPARLRVVAPEGVRWGAAAVFFATR